MPARSMTRLALSLGFHCRLAAIALLLSLLAYPLHAQGDGDEPEVAIAGGRAVHGAVLPGGTADRLTLRDSSGAGVVTVLVTPNTRIRRAQQPIHLAEIAAGETIFAFGNYDDKTHTLHALAVGVLDTAELKRAEAEFGKTYLSGEVVSIQNLDITIRRPDSVQQVIAVDDNTSFRRGRRRRGRFGPTPSPGSTDNSVSGIPAAGDDGESLTLADVHPGNLVFATGGVQHNVFTAAVLRVFPPMAATNREEPR